MLEESGVKILTNAEVFKVTKQAVTIRRNGESEILKADTAVLAMGMKAERGLWDELADRLPAVHAVGDCVEPRKIINAIWEAYNLARLI